jgi:hypothetical protein
MTRPSQGEPPDPDEADALLHELEPYIRAVPGTLPVPPDLAERVERFAIASGVDPGTVMPWHGHRNPVTGALVTSTSWPCAQCVALGRTEPLQYGKDVPDSGGYRETPIPPERLEAYLASFPEADPSPASPPATQGTAPRRGSAARRRTARRRAERQARRRNR